MEYVQSVLVNIAAASIDRAGALRADIDAHREELRQRPGFLGMRIATPSRTETGDEAWLIETRWVSNNALADYSATEPNIAGIIRRHAAIIVPNSLQTFRMEASAASTAEAVGTVYQRLALALLVPIGVLSFGLAVIYGLSRIYLEIDGNAATPIAAAIAIGILLVAAYFASNPAVPRWHYGAVAGLCAAALFGGTVWALSSDDEPLERDRLVEGSPTAAVTPSGSPVTPGQLTIDMQDNKFIASGQEAPTVTVASGATIQLTNSGKATHNMHVKPDAGYSGNFCRTAGPDACSDPATMRAGQTATITINLSAGTYEFRCDFHPQEMKGTLQVQ